jgi:hypothetical protein
MEIRVIFTLLDAEGKLVDEFEMLGPLVLWGPSESATYNVQIDGKFHVATVISYEGPTILGSNLATAKTVIQLQLT